MSKITRYTGNLLAFAANATGTNRTIFGALTQSDTLNNNINVDFLTGWEIVGVNENPTREDFNAMGFTLGQLIAYLHQWGVAEWDSLQEYNNGSITNIGGILYESKVDANIGNDPTTDDGTNWRQLDDNSITIATITPAADANVTLTTAQYNADVLVLQDGSWTSGHNIIVPDQARLYWVDNSAGSYTATIKTAVGVGVGVTAGKRKVVYCDGTDVLDPLTSITASQVLSIGASVATNALTITINPQSLDFRSATLTDGIPVTREISSPISMTVSSGSTLGTINGVPARLAILAIDNAGTVEPAIVNLAGGVNLDETTLISTTAEGGAGAADSANVIYSTTARSNVPFRVVGFIDITEATAGTWATGPTTVQGAGGNAITAMQSLGYGQTWQDVTGSRAIGTTYYNTTGRPISVHVRANTGGGGSTIRLTINGVLIGGQSQATAATAMFGTWIVPPGASYVTTLASGGSLLDWFELR